MKLNDNRFQQNADPLLTLNRPPQKISGKNKKYEIKVITLTYLKDEDGGSATKQRE